MWESLGQRKKDAIAKHPNTAENTLPRRWTSGFLVTLLLLQSVALFAVHWAVSLSLFSLFINRRCEAPGSQQSSFWLWQPTLRTFVQDHSNTWVFGETHYRTTSHFRTDMVQLLKKKRLGNKSGWKNVPISSINLELYLQNTESWTTNETGIIKFQVLVMLSVIWHVEILSPTLNFSGIWLSNFYFIFFQLINPKKEWETQKLKNSNFLVPLFPRPLQNQDNFFRAVLGSQQNWGENTEIFSISPAATKAQPPSLSISPSRLVPLLQLMDLHWHFKITQSP